uniref:Putative ovule protein n=1 Tax=Solanum chacoense TaxID=4108 RepID=A0A0V0HS38_SOLCH
MLCFNPFFYRNFCLQILINKHTVSVSLICFFGWHLCVSKKVETFLLLVEDCQYVTMVGLQGFKLYLSSLLYDNCAC